MNSLQVEVRPLVPEEVVWWNIRLNQMVRKRYRCGRSAAKPNGAWTWEVLASTEWINGSMVRQVWNQPTLEPSISAPRKWLDEHWPTAPNHGVSSPLKDWKVKARMGNSERHRQKNILVPCAAASLLPSWKACDTDCTMKAVGHHFPRARSSCNGFTTCMNNQKSSHCDNTCLITKVLEA